VLQFSERSLETFLLKNFSFVPGRKVKKLAKMFIFQTFFFLPRNGISFPNYFLISRRFQCDRTACEKSAKFCQEKPKVEI
jgi:hypothetical protein